MSGNVTYSSMIKRASGAPPPPPPPPPPPNLFPDPTIQDAGDPTDGWDIINNGVGTISDAAPGLRFLLADSQDSASLNGADLIAFDAAIADSTLYHVAITVASFAGISVTIRVSFKGGFETYTFASASRISHDITTTSGDTGFILTGDDVDNGNITVSLIEVTA